MLAAARSFTAKFDERMDDDNNTADALAVVFDLVRYANSEVPDGAPAALAKGVLDVLLELTDVLGLIVIRKGGRPGQRDRFSHRREAGGQETEGFRGSGPDPR